MRYRALDSNGDSTFGSGATVFFINSPAAVAQAVLTRLLLMTGEWFLDVTEGTPYIPDIIGRNTQLTYDRAIKDRILGTEGVVSILEYSSNLNRATRSLSVNARVDTIYSRPATIIAPGLGPLPIGNAPIGSVPGGPTTPPAPPSLPPGYAALQAKAAIWATPASIMDRQPEDTETIFEIPMTFAASFPANMAGSIAGCVTAATSDATFTLSRNGTPFCTITFPAGVSGTDAGIFTATPGVAFLFNDTFTFTAPHPQDATLKGVFFNFFGSK